MKTKCFTISYYAYQGYKSESVNTSCAGLVEPLVSEGIDALSISDAKRIETITKDDVPAIVAEQGDEVLTQNVAKCVVMIETAAFKDKAKWKVKIGEQNSVFASIEDQQFVDRIDKGVELFGKGDVLLVDMETKQTLSNGKISIQYTIKKVHDHKRSPEQLAMF